MKILKLYGDFFTAVTDNAIIPLKERVVDRFYDPFKILLRSLFGKLRK